LLRTKKPKLTFAELEIAAISENIFDFIWQPTITDSSLRISDVRYKKAVELENSKKNKYRKRKRQAVI